jgi:hypothetical protein
MRRCNNSGCDPARITSLLAGPPTKQSRLIAFCAVGGKELHNTDFQANAYTMGHLVKSPRLLEIASDYRAHCPSK